MSKQLRCFMCSYDTSWKFALMKHVRKHQNSRNDKIFDCRTPIEKYYCLKSSCPFYTYEKVVYHQHLNEPETIKKLKRSSSKITKISKCEQCSFHTRSKWSLKLHLLKDHNVVDGMQWFNCEQCSFKTQSGELFKNHQLNGHNPPEEVKWFKCDYCELKARDETIVKRHIISSHAKQLEYIYCDRPNCNFRVKKGENLVKHFQETHTPPELTPQFYQCSNCKFKTRYEETYQRHISSKHLSKRRQILRHNPDELSKWFKCDDCGFINKDESVVKTHMIKSHLKRMGWIYCDRPNCDFRVKAGDNLAKHLEEVHPTPDLIPHVYQCDKCKFNTKFKNTYIRHMIKKHGIHVLDDV